MHTIVKVTLAALGGTALLGALASPASAQFGGPPPPPNTGVPLFAAFAGTSHVTVVVDPPKGKLCWMGFRVAGDSGEIRQGNSAVARLSPLGGGCSDITAQTGQAIIDNPANYSVVVGGTAVPLTK